MSNITVPGLKIPIEVNELLQDGEVLKSKPSRLLWGGFPPYLNNRPSIHMNSNTLAWFILENSKGNYSIFFELYPFEKALEYCQKAAIMKVNKRIDQLKKLDVWSQ